MEREQFKKYTNYKTYKKRCLIFLGYIIFCIIISISYAAAQIVTNIVVWVLLIYLPIYLIKRKKQKILNRFNDTEFVIKLVQDFRSRNWADLDLSKGGCKIYCDKIVTPCQSYIYSDYDLRDLYKNGCEELSDYLGIVFGGDYHIKEFTRCIGGGPSGSYSGTISSDGHISISGNDRVAYVFDYYMIYNKNTIPSPDQPKGKKW